MRGTAARLCPARLGLGRLGLTLVAVTVLAAAISSPALGAPAVAVSPLNGTPDASPYTQISFLGVPASEISDVSVVGSRTGRHTGQMRSYQSAPGASYVPSQQFSQGERVTASASIGPKGHTSTVRTTFTVARLANFPLVTPKPQFSTGHGNTLSFHSQPKLDPSVVKVTANSGSTPGDIFVTPTHGWGQPGAMILNANGGLVWFHPVPSGDTATDLQVQAYGGQPVLTFWEGKIPYSLGVGFGRDEILNAAYQPVASVGAGNGYKADLHEFQLTPSGSAFLTAYTLVDADLSSAGGKSDGLLQDALFQEVDVATGLVMFEWHAYGHVALQDSYSEPAHYTEHPWDFFHMNSISLDPWGDGNMIISSRNTWTAYEINHITGAVMWRVGGKKSSFKMGAGTGTAYQHDVRWQPDHTLTMFDNGAVPKVHSLTRIIRERIDWKHRSVSLVGRYTGGILSGSQGNDEVLPDGNSFVGWGEEPFITEFSSTGKILFSARFPSPNQSYRAYRYTWNATPASRPALAVESSSAKATVYASWNGATGVSAWQVLGGASASSLAPVASAPSAGFETPITVPAAPAVLAVQALGPEGQVLSSSAVVPR
ncbi:MAG TPA: arylsulfotransferase family protein [Solirubrobacteraceae bacterium]|nr:arylsulfotransferase family protein [Solirubrobacteraceae bacterium]